MDLIYDLLMELPIESIMRNNCEVIITGSWQYGTNSNESDVDVVLIHDGNFKSDITNVGPSKMDNAQKIGSFKSVNGDMEYDIRFLTYTEFVRKLYSADINSAEYICSPYIYSFGGDPEIMDQLKYTFFRYSLYDPYYRYKLLRSLMGFLNPISRKKSKKFIIPEKVNQNNLIKIANLYYLLKNYYYPLNPEKGLSSMRSNDGHYVELIDTESPYYNSTEIMVEALERLNKEIEEKYPDELNYKQFVAAEKYEQVLEKIYVTEK